ncbi:hypothetical protein HZA26_02715 [Candidatus Nomurabacteria bacterium]|nr:hypothetical protein [Candidatus Nomurabacteria bacterium]
MEKQKVIDRLVLLIAIVAVAFGAYFYYQWSLLKQNPQTVAQAEIRDLVAKVSKLVVLPEETPTVATVADTEPLKGQAFFAKAVKGDKVLIYTTARKAYLYSVSMNKILEVAPLNIGDSVKSGSTQ